MMDLKKMKSAAAAATQGMWARNRVFGQLNVQDDKFMLTDADAVFIAAANPAAVQELIALTERLQSELTAERATIQRMTVAAYDDAEKVDRLEEAAKALGALTDERAAFEAWSDSTWKYNLKPANQETADTYMEGETETAWMGWQARAALAPSIQALPVVAQGCSGDATCCPNNEGYGCDCSPAAAQPEAKEAPAALSDEQQRQVEKCLKDGAIMGSVSDATVEVVRSRLAAAGNSHDAKDAARYRWLREKGYGMPKQEEELDSAIDAAMAAAPSPAEGA